LRWWFERTGLAIEAKADGSPVTAADRAAEDLLRQRVAERFPEHAFEGEERGRTGWKTLSTAGSATRSTGR